MPEATQLVTRPQGIQKEVAQPEGRGLRHGGIRKGTQRSQAHSTHLEDEETDPERVRDGPKGRIVAEMRMESWGEGPRAMSALHQVSSPMKVLLASGEAVKIRVAVVRWEGSGNGRPPGIASPPSLVLCPHFSPGPPPPICPGVQG